MNGSLGRLPGDSEIDRILSREEEILPSSGFAASVMDAVRREAAAPPPIPFPWKRALPVLVVASLAIIIIIIGAAVVVSQLGSATTSQVSVAAPEPMPSIFNGSGVSAAIWTAMALVVSLVAVRLSMRLTSGRA
jgi:hypothetical protein